MLPNIKQDIYIRDFKCAPKENYEQDISIWFKSTRGVISLTKCEVSCQTRYKLEIIDLDKIGSFSNREKAAEVMDDLLLSINFFLHPSIAASKRKLPPEGSLQVNPFTVDERVEEEPHFEITSKLIYHPELDETEIHYCRDMVNTKFSEGSILKSLRLIRRCNRHSPPVSDTKISNLSESLDTYEEAMSQPSLKQAFINLCISIDKAVNYEEGSGSTGEDLDKKMMNIYKSATENKLLKMRNEIKKGEVTEVRRSLNRLKHSDRDEKDTKKRKKLESNLPNRIIKLREFANAIILKRLNDL